jgi:hypothetical protein
MNKMIVKILMIGFIFLSILAWADDDPTMSSISTSVLSVADMVVNLIFGLCYTVGIIFGFMTLIFFRRYRQNPVETTLSKVIWIFFIGVIIFLLPFIAQSLNFYQTINNAAQQDPHTINS